MPECLNCGTELHGAFCSRCGQRAVPPYPTLREMAVDTWHEISGWDGRYARTLRTLVHPGTLTVESLEGRRARYVAPLRLYLFASVVYFLIVSTVPGLSPGRATVELDNRQYQLSPDMSADERAEILRQLDRGPWWAQLLIRPAVEDFGTVQGRFIETFPRALFFLVPVFAGIVALLHRKRPFPQHLIFALHVHAAFFLVFAGVRLVSLTRSRTLVSLAGLLAFIGAAVYVLRAFRVVYGGRWRWIIGKALVIGILYFIAVTVAVLANFAWVVLT